MPIKFSALFINASYTSKDTGHFVNRDQVSFQVDTPSMANHGKPSLWPEFEKKDIPYHKDGVYLTTNDWAGGEPPVTEFIGGHPLVAKITNQLEDIYLNQVLKGHTPPDNLDKPFMEQLMEEMQNLHVSKPSDDGLPLVGVNTTSRSINHSLDKGVGEDIQTLLNDLFKSQRTDLLETPWLNSVFKRCLELSTRLNKATIASFGNRVWDLGYIRTNERFKSNTE